MTFGVFLILERRFVAGEGLLAAAPRELPMITLDDCIALCGLSEEEVLAIAEHEHIPEIAATELAEYLLMRDKGPEKIGAMIVDDIREAQKSGDRAHVVSLLHVLHHFLRKYPEASPGTHPWSSAM